MRWLHSCGLFRIGALSGCWPAKERVAIMGFKIVATPEGWIKTSAVARISNDD